MEQINLSGAKACRMLYYTSTDGNFYFFLRYVLSNW